MEDMNNITHVNEKLGPGPTRADVGHIDDFYAHAK